MKALDFLNLNTLKKLNKEFDTHLDTIKYEYDSSVIVEHKSFKENQHVGYGRNGASTLVSLQSIFHECKALQFTRPYAKSTSIDLYIKADAKAGQGARNEHTRIVYKDAKGKTQTLDDVTVDSLTSRFGRIYKNIEVEQTSAFSNIVSIVKTNEKEDVSDSVYRDFIYHLDYNYETAIKKFCDSQNIELLDTFHYTHCFSIPVQNIKHTANKIVFAYHSTSTYNTLPEMITITKTKKLKTTRLCDIGIETKGYYSHTDKMMIRNEDLEAALAFKAEFDKI